MLDIEVQFLIVIVKDISGSHTGVSIEKSQESSTELPVIFYQSISSKKPIKPKINQ
jgi:hypothetical protein